MSRRNPPVPKLNETTDGFGIVTRWRTGALTLSQRAPGAKKWTQWTYDSPAEAREAFHYVKSRSHYGRSLRRRANPPLRWSKTRRGWVSSQVTSGWHAKIRKASGGYDATVYNGRGVSTDNYSGARSLADAKLRARAMLANELRHDRRWGDVEIPARLNPRRGGTHKEKAQLAIEAAYYAAEATRMRSDIPPSIATMEDDWQNGRGDQARKAAKALMRQLGKGTVRAKLAAFVSASFLADGGQDAWQARRRANPACGHSACSQHYIDTGDKRCLRAGKKGRDPIPKKVQRGSRRNPVPKGYKVYHVTTRTGFKQTYTIAAKSRGHAAKAWAYAAWRAGDDYRMKSLPKTGKGAWATANRYEIHKRPRAGDAETRVVLAVEEAPAYR